MSIAVFDVDRTLLEGDALLLAARKSNSNAKLLWLSISFLPYLILWKLKILTTQRIKEIFINKFKICDRYNIETKRNNQDWLINDLKKMIRKEALIRLDMHREKGDIVVLCSASPDMILNPLAKSLNVDLICTNLVKQENQWLPKIIGKNCKGNEKLKRLEDKYGLIKNQKLEVYGDSNGDKEILNAASIPHYRDFSDLPKEYPTFSFNSIIPIIGFTFLFYLIINNFGKYSTPEKEWNDIWINILTGEILIITSYLIRFFRWKIILKKINLNPHPIQNFYIWMGSFAFTATPGKAGEGIRVIMLNKECNLPIFETTCALLVERLTDIIAILIILISNLNLLPNIYYKNIITFVFMIIITISLLIIFFVKRNLIKNIALFIIRRFYPNKIVHLNNLNIVKLLIHPKNITIAIILGLIAWVFEGISLLIILKGFNFSISWLGCTFAHTTSALIGALTLMPGGVGPTEASTIGLLSLQSIPLSIATSSTLLIRLMTLWFATFLGFICLILNSYMFRKNSLAYRNQSNNQIN